MHPLFEEKTMFLKTTALVCLAVTCALTAPAPADDLYAALFGELYKVDTDAQTVTLIGPALSYSSLAALDENTLYAKHGGGTLYSVDVNTGEWAPIVEMDDDTSSIAYRPQDGMLYSITRNQAYWACDDQYVPPVVYSVDPNTGRIETVVQIDMSKVDFCHRVLGAESLAFDESGDAYVVMLATSLEDDSWKKRLFELDLETGVITELALVGEGEVDIVESLSDFTARQGGGFWGSFRFYKDPELNFGSFDAETVDIRDTDTINWMYLFEDGSNFASLTVIPSSCAADVNGDGALDVLDFVAFQTMFVDQDPAADCDADGNFTILDFVCYQQLFQAGCN
jgi:outer membrane protein assembly factor BamB